MFYYSKLLENTTFYHYMIFSNVIIFANHWPTENYNLADEIFVINLFFFVNFYSFFSSNSCKIRKVKSKLKVAKNQTLVNFWDHLLYKMNNLKIYILMSLGPSKIRVSKLSGMIILWREMPYIDSTKSLIINSTRSILLDRAH